MTEPLLPEEIDVANTEALEELAWAIEAAQGEFKLILARCNYINLRDRLVQQLQKLCAVPLQTLTLSETAQSLYATIRAELGEEQPAALMVFGLESVRDLEQVLTATNQVREEFRKHFHFPLVLWIHDDVLKTLVRLAPDFESWATVTEFAIAPNTLLQTLRQEIEELFATLLGPKAGISFHSLLQQLNLIVLRSVDLEAALKDLQGQVLDPDLQAGLDFCQGLNQEKQAVALQYFQNSLMFWKQHAAPLRAGILLFYIGQYRYAIANQERRHPVDWEEVRQPLQECIEIFEQANRLGLVAKCITSLERVLQKLEAWDELENIAQKAIALHQNYGSRFRLAQDYGFLAKVYLEHQEWTKAQHAAQQALETLVKVPNNQNWLQGLYLFFLARAQRQLGDQEAAIASLLKAQALGDQGYPTVYIDTLKELQSLYRDRKQYLEAFQAKQLRLSIEQQYGIRAFVGAGRLQPKREEVAEEVGTWQHEQQVAETGEVAPEIIASGRQQDLEALLQRIGRNDCKLIVVHGPSGVGKSSLVTAGLLPALQHRAIGVQENLPVLIRKYTDWIEVLGEELAQALEAIAHQRELATVQGRTFPVEPTPHYTLPAILEQLRQNEQDNLRTILIFDQFEEFFFACTEPLQRRQFFEFLGECLHVLSLKVILSLREDYLHHLLECNRLESMKIIEQDILGCRVLYGLGNFTPTAAKAIIQDLTERAQFYLEPALVDKVVVDLAGELEEVRPIELQIVGAQLQTEAITTLAHYCQRGPKQELVKRYLSEVVEDCGPENHDMAELVLYLLTDEKGTRPLKTRAELERDLQALVTDVNDGAKKLDLVLQIFVESGLVVLLKESPADRYQLVHDYLAAFIRQQQEPKLQGLMAELEAERQQRKLGEAKLNRFLKRALVGSVTAGFGLAALATVAIVSAQQAEKQRKRAELSEIEALNTSSEALFASNQTFDALHQGLKAASQLQTIGWAPPNKQVETAATLRQAIYAIQETNRLEAHNGYVNSVIFSPDGKTLASASDDRTIKLWSTRGQLLKTLKGHSNNVTSVSFSPDGKTIASSSKDNTIKLWNTRGRCLKTLQGHGDYIWGITFSPDGKTLASASSDGTIKIWSIQGELLKTLKGHKNWVASVSFSPDGKTLASASTDNTIKLWNTQGQELKTLKGHKSWVVSVSFSPDGKTLASASYDNTIKLWNTQGQELKTLKGHDSYVWKVSFSPDGKTLASASYDNTIKLWNTQGQELKTLKGHNYFVLSVSFSPDGKTLASASGDNTIKLWNIQSPELQIFKNHNHSFNSVSFSPDGKTIASASDDNTIKLWNTRGQLLKVLIGHSKAVLSVSFSPDGKTLASASRDNTIKLWNMQGQLLQTLYDFAWNIQFSPDSKIIASASHDKAIRLWNIQGQLLKTLKGHTDVVNSISFSPDGKTIVSASKDSTVKLWNIHGQLLKTLKGHAGHVWSVSFSPDGKYIASGGNKTIKLWNAQGQLLRAFEGHHDSIRSISFSPDGKTIASASADTTVKLWNLQGQEIKTLKGHNSYIWSVSFSPDGKTLASASNDRTVRLWNLDLQNLVARSCVWLQNYLTTHPESLSELKSCQTPNLLRAAAPTLVTQGEELARKGNVEDAVTTFQQALAWNANLKLLPKQRAQNLARSQQLITDGEDLAQQENLQATINKLQEAVKLDPSLEINPENKAKQLVAAAIAQQAQNLVDQKKYKETIATYTQAQKLDPDAVSAGSLSSLCWEGSLNGAAQVVLTTCEQAVSLSPSNGDIRDSRGLARALTGNTQGAIADFQAFINWVSEDNWGSEAKKAKAQRQRWVTALQAGKNPFTPKELKELREE